MQVRRAIRQATGAIRRPGGAHTTALQPPRPPPSAPFSSTSVQRAPLSVCPTCSTPLPGASDPTCPHCTAFLPVPDPPPSFFSLFSLPRSFVVDRSDIKRNYLGWQQRVHPDLAAGKANSVKGTGAADEARLARLQEAWARDWSSIVNKANSTLSDDLRRAEYLLNEAGLEIGEEDAVSDPELLMSILETREALEAATTEEEVAAIRQVNLAEKAATVEALTAAFATDPLPADVAKELTIKLRYLDNVEQVCREWQPGGRLELHH